MQAIARVNRVFKDKPGGLVVDYLGLAQDLKKALATYTESGGRGKTALDQEEAVAVMLEKYDVCCALFHEFDWSKWTSGSAQERMGLLPAAQEHILVSGGRQRSVPDCRARVVSGLCLGRATFGNISDSRRRGVLPGCEGGIVETVRLRKSRTEEELDLAVRQIISRAVASEGVMDIFAAAGLDKPDISVLSDEFLAEVQGMPHRNLAVELLQKLLSGEVSNASAQERGASSILCRDAGADVASLPEPGHRGGAGD